MNKAEEKQIRIYKKMSADKKISIVDDMFEFCWNAKKDHSEKVGKMKKLLSISTKDI